MNKLPQGWTTSRLGNICSVKTGKKDVNEGADDGKYPFFTCAQQIHRINSCPFDGEAILVAGNGFFNVKYYAGKFDAYQRTYILQDFTIDGKYLYRFIQSRLKDITKDNRGSTIRYIRLGDLTEHVVPIAPYNEQKRIAIKLEKLLDKLDVYNERLNKIPLIIKRFRQSVLAAACSGRLTADWRKQHSQDADWQRCKLSDLGNITGGITKNSKRKSLKLQVPYLRVANVYENRLELDNVLKIGVTQQGFERTLLMKDDILFVEGNGSLEQIGRVALWDGSISRCVHQNHLIKFRAGNNVLPAYILYQMMSPLGREQLKNKATSSAGLNTLSISKISDVSLSITTLPEQAEIVRRVNNLFSLANELEERFKTAKEYVDRMTPSVLAKAFRGELVDQDPSDEPASELLKRIKNNTAHAKV